jgi:hypothetical protein
MAILPTVAAGSMHGAIVPIASVILSSPTDPINFTNIPQVYQDLLIVTYARGTVASILENLVCYPNGITGTSNASDTSLIGDGSSATSSRYSNAYNTWGVIPSASATSGIFGATETHILNYSNTTTYKTFLTRSAADLNGSGKTTLNVSLWRATAAITSLSIYAASANFATGTSINLYGIRTVGQ